MIKGTEVHFYFNGNAGTAQPVAVYRAGTGTALNSAGALSDTTGRIVITDIVIVNGHTDVATCEAFDNAGTATTVEAGEVIVGGAFAANGGVALHYQTPHYCRRGVTFYIKASAGTSVYVTGKGYIINS